MSNSRRRNANQRNNSKSISDFESSQSSIDDVEEEEKYISKGGKNLEWKQPQPQTVNHNGEISGRKSYRNSYRNSTETPEFPRYENKKKTKQTPKTESQQTTSNQWYQNKYSLYLLFIFLIVVFMIKGSYFQNQGTIEKQKQEFSLKTIKENFPHQKNILWTSINSGINQTIFKQKPSLYIFLFENEATETMKKLLQEISKYAVCKLANCESSAIDLKEEISANFSDIKDYGLVISNLKPKLENSGLMIVEDLDEIPGIIAQAFHNFCDKVTPLVKKSAFFFTMKVANLEDTDRNHLRYMERILKEKWQNIEEDKFDPIFTRITSGLFLKVYPENGKENANPYVDQNPG